MTVEEWLGKDNTLGIDIWEKKYRYNGESFDEWLDRVSGGDAELREYIKDKKFMFGGRITANRGTNKNATMMNCFVAGTKVITKDGIKNIEDVRIGDYVISDDNNWHKVNDVMKREYSGDLYKIKAQGLYDDIVCTPNHKFLTQNGWIRADRLLGGCEGGRINSPDRLKIPDLRFNYRRDKIDFAEHFIESKNKKIIVEDDGKLRVQNRVNQKGTMCWTREGYPVNRYIEPDDDFYYFIGYWLADGSITRLKGRRNPSILQIVFNATNDEENARYIASVGEKYFGIKPSVTYTKQNVIAVRFCNEIIGSWFLGEFGEKCDGKHVDDKYMGNYPMAIGLIDGDGCLSTHGNFHIVLKNYQLLSWLRNTLFLNGILSSKIVPQEGQDNTYKFAISSYLINQKLQKDMHKKSWDYKNDNIPQYSSLNRDYVSINNISIIENTNETVYNLSVEDVHSYTANGVFVHNCYSRGFVGDSLSEIMKANTDIAMTFKAQGGQGLSLSKIRPKGTGINNGQFKSDGIIPFMEIFNKTTESVSQGGSRKGALLMSLDVWHKEAKDFITIKSDQNKIQKANLSLEIDDEFMEDVEKYYKTGDVVKKHIVRDYNGNKVEYDVCPIEVYKLMMQQAWDSGEPGVLLTRRFRNYNLMEYCNDYNIECCNPCTTGDTLILTDEGFVEIQSVIDKKINVWNGYMFSEVVPRKTGTNQEIYEVEFSNGAKLKCTPYHKFILEDGSRVECKDLSVGDKLIKCNMPIIDGENKLEHPYTQGFYSGDGFDCKGRNAAYISFYGDKKPLSQYCDVISQREMSDKRDTYSVAVDYHDKEFVPINYNIKSKVRWLEGIVDSDGTRGSKEGSLQITSTNKKFLYNVFLMLETLGIQSAVSLSKEECDKYFPEQMGGKYYHCNAAYRLLIKPSDVVILRNLGFAPHRVDVKCNPSRNAQRFVTIKSVKNTGTREDVYCFTEEINHSGIFNGVITGQCGEQPLAKNAACDLGSINLAKFVINEFEPDARFDIESFGKVIDCGVRSLDLIIDENEKNHALEEQRLQSKNYRNIGLGVMGLYDCLVEMNMTYGSKESIDFIDSLFGYMFRRAVIASSKLAAEKGAFPMYSDNVLKSEIIRKHFTEDDLNILGIRKNGLRNCSLLSIAPTGSIGTMFNIGTGCEPAFMISFTRKTESLKGKDEYYTVYMDVAQRYKDSHKGSDLPDTFVTSQNIKWKDRINVQATIQEHVDTGISSTVNLPNETTVEEVEQLYLYAWKKGLKGVTIFRDGCKRAGILTTGDKKEAENKTTMNNIPRGVIIKADDNCIGKKRTLRTGCGSLHIQAFFDPDTGDLLETFFSRGSSGGCTNSYTGLSRMISLSARAGVDIYSIVDQLKSSGVCPSYAVRGATKHDTSKGSSCPVAIGNALLDMYNEVKDDIGIEEPVQKKVVKVESKTVSKKLFKNDQDAIDNGCCPQCGSALIRTGGCINCIGCGWTKCD